jgi:hypothetical protein
LVNNLNGVGGRETIVATSDPFRKYKSMGIPKSDKWEFKVIIKSSAFNNFKFCSGSYNNRFYGNDVLIDDILVRQIPKSCNTVASFL